MKNKKKTEPAPTINEQLLSELKELRIMFRERSTLLDRQLQQIWREVMDQGEPLTKAIQKVEDAATLEKKDRKTWLLELLTQTVNHVEQYAPKKPEANDKTT